MKRGFHPAAAGCLKSDILEEHPLTAVSELCVADGHAHMLPGRRAHRGQMPLPATVEFVYSRLVETTLPSQRLSAEETISAELAGRKKELGRLCAYSESTLVHQRAHQHPYDARRKSIF